jgi:hypothetical protein
MAHNRNTPAIAAAGAAAGAVVVLWLWCGSCQVAAVLVVSDEQLRRVLQQELGVISLLAKLDPAKVRVWA